MFEILTYYYFFPVYSMCIVQKKKKKFIFVCMYSNAMMTYYICPDIEHIAWNSLTYLTMQYVDIYSIFRVTNVSDIQPE